MNLRCLAAAASLVATIAVGTAARAAEPGDVGKTFEGVISVAGRQIPLPQGPWMLAGRSLEQAEQVGKEPYGAIESVVLLRTEGSRVVAFVIANGNLAPLEEGWGTASECINEDGELALAINFDAAAAHTFCGFVGMIRPVVTRETAGSWRAAALFAQERGWTPPAEFAMAGYRLSDQQDITDVRYHFDPDLQEAAAPAEARPPVAELSRWLAGMRDSVRAGFVNGLDGVAVMAMPWTETGPQIPPVMQHRLAELEGLKAKGVLTEAEFDAQRDILLTTKPRVVGAQMSNEMFTAIKVAADQVTAAVPTFIGNYATLGSLPQATTLLGLQTVVDIAHDFSIEWAWNTWGPQRLREEPTIDLPEAGVLVGGDAD
ncbi:MAG: SHOCT domain-containing protein [Geminicoccaceae bacterium]